MRLDDWPFEDPKNVAVFTTRSILLGDKPILLVTHDEEDGAWQFHDGREPKMAEVMVVALSTIVRHDPSVTELADLPYGWQADRDTLTSLWRRSRNS